MRVAVPICRGRVSPVFDVARRYRVTDLHSGEITDQAEHVVCGEPCTELMGLAVDRVICAGISCELRRCLERRGISVLAGYCGVVEEVMDAYCRGCLGSGDFRMPGSEIQHREGSQRTGVKAGGSERSGITPFTDHRRSRDATP